MKRDFDRCYRDDAVMVEYKPGKLRCTLCGFTTEVVGYDRDEVAEMFDEEVEYKARLAKHGSARKGRRRKREYPRPKWIDTGAVVQKHNAGLGKAK